VSPDQRLARHLLDDAARHLRTAPAVLAAGDHSGAYQLAYDALRKAASALLAVHGLRATSRGGHVAVQEAMTALYSDAVPALRSFNRLRRARNSFEYPGPDTVGPDAAEVEDALAVAAAVEAAARQMVDEGVPVPW
jgi:HEPN domain-containing protein